MTIPSHEKHDIKTKFSFVLYYSGNKNWLPLIAKERLISLDRAWRDNDFKILYYMHLLATLAVNPVGNLAFKWLHSATFDGWFPILTSKGGGNEGERKSG